MKIYFTSDWHLGHFNIIRYCNRPFKTLEQMNNTIINNCNSRVKENDMLFYLGDFCFRSKSERGEGEKDKAEYYRNKINCKNIIFICGNHDVKGRNTLKTPIYNMTIKHGGKKMFLVHNPEYCNTDYEINLTAHVHEKWVFKRYKKGFSFTDCCNVSVEQWKYYPITINEIFSKYYRWKKKEMNYEE